MIDQKINSGKFQQKITKILENSWIMKIHPNRITFFALLFGVLGAFGFGSISLFDLQFCYPEAWIEFLSDPQQITTLKLQVGDYIYGISLFFFVLSFLADILDGIIARKVGPSIFGGIMDIFYDRIVEISWILSLISLDFSSLSVPGIFSLAAIIMCITMFLTVSAAGATNPEYIENLNLKRKAIFYSGGLMERTETFIFLFLISLLIPFQAYLMWTFAILVFFTALQRYFQAKKIFMEKTKTFRKISD